MLKCVEITTTYENHSVTYGPFDEVEGRKFIDDAKKQLGKLCKSIYFVDLMSPDTFSVPDGD